MLKDYCKECNIFGDDEFIGLRFENGKPVVTFPRGYRLSEEDVDVRKDIIRLLAILHRFNDKKEGTEKNNKK